MLFVVTDIGKDKNKSDRIDPLISSLMITEISIYKIDDIIVLVKHSLLWVEFISGRD